MSENKMLKSERDRRVEVVTIVLQVNCVLVMNLTTLPAEGMQWCSKNYPGSWHP